MQRCCIHIAGVVLLAGGLFTSPSSNLAATPRAISAVRLCSMLSNGYAELPFRRLNHHARDMMVPWASLGDVNLNISKAGSL